MRILVAIEDDMLWEDVLATLRWCVRFGVVIASWLSVSRPPCSPDFLARRSPIPGGRS